MEAKRKCTACHKPLNASAKFCNFCGQKQPLLTAAALRTDQKFFSGQELAGLRNTLNEQDSAELSGLFTHSNKYLVALALEIFLRKAPKASKEAELLKYADRENFLACLLDQQPDAPELYAQLWDKAAANPWLARKYLLWGAQKKYKLNPETEKYLEAAKDDYLTVVLKK